MLMKIEVEQTPQLTELSEIKGLLNTLIAEVQSLRRERLPASPADIEALLSAIYIFYPDSSFTAAWLLEYSIDSDPDSAILLKAITGAIGRKPSISRLSRFLRRSVGAYGNMRLQVIDHHSRDGATFLVTIVTK